MTYSIVARDAATGEIGAAVQSCHPWVGAVVLWARPGVGAVATQAFAQPSFGPAGLDLLAAGHTPADTLAQLVASDDGAPRRQVSVLDARGAAAAHTGSGCVSEAGHLTGDGWAVAANMMERASVWPAMAQAFADAPGDLAHRLLAALDAAEAEGGDMRGRQAAALQVVAAEAAPTGTGVVLDLRVDDHPAPLVELRRLTDLAGAYAEFDLALSRIDVLDLDGALEAIGRALDHHPRFLDAEVARLSLLLLTDRAHQAEEELATWLRRAPAADEVSGALDARARLSLVWHRMMSAGLVPLDPAVVDALLA